VGDLQRRSYDNKYNTQEIYLNTYLGSNSELETVNGSGREKCYTQSGKLHTNYYGGITPRLNTEVTSL
jgi:hypothetical protein